MNENELLEALIDATRRAPGGEGVTVTEIAEATGVNDARIRRVIKSALAQGRVEVLTKRVVAISGRICSVPSYRLKPS